MRALALLGAQVLDLEALAAHRGSVLGDLPDAPQPAQKMFESLVWSALHRFDPARPVFVEAESKKIGNLRVPQTLIAAMWESDCLKLDAPVEMRVEMLIEEYRHFVANPAALGAQLDCLVAHYGQQQIAAWKLLARCQRRVGIRSCASCSNCTTIPPTPARRLNIIRNWSRASRLPLPRTAMLHLNALPRIAWQTWLKIIHAG